MNRLLTLAILIALPSFAQQQQPTVEDMRLVVQAVIEQRNAAQNTLAEARRVIAVVILPWTEWAALMLPIVVVILAAAIIVRGGDSDRTPCA